jgi:hypothetical protein
MPEQPGKGEGGNGRLNEHSGVLHQGLVKGRQSHSGQIKGFHPFVLPGGQRGVFRPVAAGEPVGVQVNADKLHSFPPGNVIVRQNSGIVDHASMRGNDLLRPFSNKQMLSDCCVSSYPAGCYSKKRGQFLPRAPAFTFRKGQ